MSENVEQLNKFHNFSLDSFKKSQSAMIATSEAAVRGFPSGGQWTSRIKTYTANEVEKILESGSLTELQRLSRNYFSKGGYYK